MRLNRQRHHGTRARDAGFSLIELLVSLTLLALLMTMVPGTLRLSKRAWEKASATNESIEAATLAFAAHQVESAIPFYTRDAAGLQALAFSGNSSSLTFVTELANGPEGGGLYQISIAPEKISTEGSSYYIVQIGVFSTEQTPPKIQPDMRSLRPRYASISFRYFGSATPGSAASWSNNWPRKDRLPDLVEIRAQRAGQQQPSVEVQKFELKLRPI